MADTRKSHHGGEPHPDSTAHEPGSHPIGTGAGAAGGGVTGAAIGTAVGGPVGGAVGAVLGALAGAYAGKGIAETIDLTAEDTYWREQHLKQPYAHKGHSYEKYAPAYRTGYQGYGKHERGTRFEDAEPTLRSDYESSVREQLGHTATAVATGGLGSSSLGAAPGPGGAMVAITSSGETVPVSAPLAWEEARPAAKAAWERVERGEAVRVPLAEEQVSVGKQEVESEAVQVHKVVETETVQQPVELRREEIKIERVTKDEPAPASAFKEEEIQVPLTREEAVVEKRAHVTGEVKVRKVSRTEVEQVKETVRKEEVKLEGENQDQERSSR